MQVFNLDIVNFIYIFGFLDEFLMFFIIFIFLKKIFKNLLTKRNFRI